MIVYSAREAPLEAAKALAQFVADCGRAASAAIASRDDVLALVVDFGRLEAAVADRWCTPCDTVSDRLGALRRVSVALGHALHHAALGVAEASAWLRRAESMAAGLTVGGTHPAGVHEGFAYYAVYPEAYMEAARRFAAGRAAGAATVVGIRSIGAPLSGVVAAALEQVGWRVATWTVRPRGHPFDRRLAVDAAMRQAWRQAAGSEFLVVDEGPGLSGSSFASVARALVENGVPEPRIALFPSHEADPRTFVSDEARAQWARHPVWTCGFEEAGLRPDADLDLSAGAWRPRNAPIGTETPAAHPQHERRKYLRRAAAAGTDVLLKFEGLGRYGADRRARAERLHAAGFAPRAGGLEHGFLAMDWASGRRGDRGTVDRELVETAGRYIGHLRHEESGPGMADPAPLLEMIRTNVVELLGDAAGGTLPQVEAAAARLRPQPETAVDGRLQPHEWVRTEARWLKTDALDHHDDHFFPGRHDACWDLAGATVELGLSARGAARLLAAYRQASADDDAERRLPFYTVAYLAFRGAYAALAAQTLGGSAEGRRFAALGGAYRGSLAAALAAL